MKPRKRFAQHFLEPAWVTRLIAAIEPQPTDCVLEIGPGRGALTIPLAARVGRLVAVEIDRELAVALEARRISHVDVITADVLAVDLDQLLRDHCAAPTDPGEEARRLRVVGNLPYYISSPILFRLLDAARRSPLFDATVMVQKEVADRLVAGPATSEYGALTLGVALGADVSVVFRLPPGAFRPPPKVHSAVVRLRFRPPPDEIGDPDLVSALVRSVFTRRRKTLGNALTPFAEARGLTARTLLARAEIDPVRRAETLSLQEFGRLAGAVSAPRAT